MPAELLPDDMFNILVATDVHMGYNEDDPIRGLDSFNSFEEILEIALKNDVDFILLCGDLLDKAKPSTDCLLRCADLLRKYCLGDRPISFEFVGDQSKVFENSSQKVVNYEDPNINVSMPIFSIHGNHDDPTGPSMVCSLDVLSSAGFVNYFGKNLDLSKVTVNPLLLRKGESYLAIYGLSHVKDRRLSRLFEQDQVTFYRAEEHLENWFNICVLHQNRADRGHKNFIREEALPEFLDLVLWGHEHDCLIEPELNGKQNFYVSQPGSSVVTSLSEGEAKRKHVGLLKVNKKNFKMEPILLESVRPYIFRSICASELDLDPMAEEREQVEQRAEEEVYSMIEESKRQLTGHRHQPTLPLIRLVLFYTNEDQMFNIIRFGQKFEEEVANPSEILLFRRRFDKKEQRDVLAGDVMQGVLSRAAYVMDIRVEDYIKKYFRDVDDDDQYRMSVLTAAGLNEAVTAMVDKEDSSALDEIKKYQCLRMKTHLLRGDVSDHELDQEIRNFNQQRAEKTELEADEIRTHLQGANRLTNQTNGDVVVEADTSIIDDEEEAPTQGRGRAVRGARGPRASRAGAKAGARAGARGAARSATRTPRASRAASASSRNGGQRTLQETINSQIAVVRTSARSTANRSRLNFLDDDDDDE